jgi:hypothetical protein
LLYLMTLGPLPCGLVWAGGGAREADPTGPYLVNGEDLENEQGPRYAIQFNMGADAKSHALCHRSFEPIAVAEPANRDPGQVRRAQIRELFFMHHAPVAEPRKMSLEERNALRRELNSAVRDAYGLDHFP